jgi:glutathione peroxidase
VLAFPCNDFGAQEPGSVEEIQQFCSTTYGVNFPIYAKVAISAAPFDTLVQAEPAGPVAWNFEKFLVGKNGSVIARFKSGVEPESAELKGAIEAALAA